MKVLWFEFALSLRRLFRRRVQNGLMLVTFAVSVTLSLLSWSLFHTVHLSQPDFDPKGDYYIMSHVGSSAMGFRAHSSHEELEAFRKGQTVFSEFNELIFYNSLFIHIPGGEERFLGAYLTSKVMQAVGAKPLKGRLFIPADDKYGAPMVALLSQRM